MRQIVLHKPCGKPVTIAILQHDVALYIWCNDCGDIVEAGELDVPGGVDEETGRGINDRDFRVIMELEGKEH